MKEYLVGLTGAAILAALIRRVAPKGAEGRGARLGAGLLVLICMLGPLGKLNVAAGAKRMARWSYTPVMEADEVARESNRLMESLISEAAETYILDKAQAMELTCSAEVSVRLKKQYPIPWSVVIHGHGTQSQKKALTEAIASELGIPEERQEWLDM